MSREQSNIPRKFPKMKTPTFRHRHLPNGVLSGKNRAQRERVISGMQAMRSYLNPVGTSFIRYF